MVLTLYFKEKEPVVIEGVTYNIYFQRKNVLQYEVGPKKYEVSDIIGFAVQEDIKKYNI